MSEIVSIVYKPESAQRDAPEHYTRVPLASATLVVGGGIEGDRKGKHPDRQLNIMSLETLGRLRAEGFHTEPGQMGEQIVVQGLDVAALAQGAVLQLGEAARVEVVKPRTGCERFEAVQGRSREQAAEGLGVVARVVTGGPIRVGDAVKIVVER